jgi:hypothetical protein
MIASTVPVRSGFELVLWDDQNRKGRPVFLNMLTTDEKRAFVHLAQQLIEVDGVVIGREESALAALKAEMGVADDGSDDRSVETLARTFGSRRSRVAALLELYGLAYSDADFETREGTMVATVAHQMGLSTDDVESIEAWVRDHVALVRRAMVLMRE